MQPEPSAAAYRRAGELAHQMLTRIAEETERPAPVTPSLEDPPSTLQVERHYSVAAVADLLEVSKPWVYDRIKDGRLPVVELGDTKSKQRISASALQAFLDARTFRTAP